LGELADADNLGVPALGHFLLGRGDPGVVAGVPAQLVSGGEVLPGVGDLLA
jgi:hypothetical protein